MENVFSQLSPWTVFLGIVVFWFAASTLMGIMSGWRRLAESYPFVENQAKRLFLWGCRVNWANYTQVIVLTTDEQSLHIQTSSFFRPGHPPMSIPWNEIRGQKVKGLVGDVLQLSFQRDDSVKINLRWKVKDKFRLASHDKLVLLDNVPTA